MLARMLLAALLAVASATAQNGPHDWEIRMSILRDKLHKAHEDEAAKNTARRNEISARQQAAARDCNRKVQACGNSIPCRTAVQVDCARVQCELNGQFLEEEDRHKTADIVLDRRFAHDAADIAIYSKGAAGDVRRARDKAKLDRDDHMADIEVRFLHDTLPSRKVKACCQPKDKGCRQRARAIYDAKDHEKQVAEEEEERLYRRALLKISEARTAGGM